MTDEVMNVGISVYYGNFVDSASADRPHHLPHFVRKKGRSVEVLLFASVITVISAAAAQSLPQ